MTFTVTPQPNNVPPRVRIDIDSDDPATPFTSITVSRDGKPLREQPFAGSQSAVLYDYEAPFGTPATYSVSGSLSVSPVTIYTTAWANLTGWATVSGSPSVSGGRLVSGSVSRAVTLPARGILTVDSPFTGTTFSTAALSFGPALKVDRSSENVRVTVNSVTKPVVWTGGAMQVQWSGSETIVTTNGGVVSFASAVPPGSVTLTATASGGTSPSVSSFSLLEQGAATPFTAPTRTTTLNVVDTWLIHPSRPALSIPIYSHQSSDGVRYIEASSGESKTSQAASTVHRAVGRSRAVVITSGPRQADEWTLVVESLTIAAKNALRAIVNDQTPLLFRSPADVVMDLPDDWYSVGDVTVSRVEVPVITQRTLMTMPLTPVDEPIVRVGALWNAGKVLTTYATAGQVLARFDTALDLMAGPS